VLRDVAVIATDDVSPFELSIYLEVFGVDRSARGLPRYSFDLVTLDPSRPVASSAGVSLNVRHGLERTSSANLVALAPSKPWDREYPPEVLQCLRDAVTRGAKVMSICTAAFGLAAAGLLDNRAATTHWMYADNLADRFPRVRVNPAVLYVDEDPVLTSAGTASGIDACLHQIRKAQGSAVANAIARCMVVPPHRTGGQSQFVDSPVPTVDTRDTLAPLLEWVQANLQQDLSIAALASRAHMSPRTFIRRFRAATGTTPFTWVLQQRILMAESLLEERFDLSVERVAELSGFGSAAVLRHHFVRERGVPPLAYRRAFVSSPASGSPTPPPARRASA
jgi:transcriptional regulator GlxA family with amidase domain